jgi:hypothetical protein
MVRVRRRYRAANSHSAWISFWGAGQLLKAGPRHSSVRLKKVGVLYSARIGLHYRALAKERPDGLQWFWIGHHSTYDRLLKS